LSRSTTVKKYVSKASIQALVDIVHSERDVGNIVASVIEFFGLSTKKIVRLDKDTFESRTKIYTERMVSYVTNNKSMDNIVGVVEFRKTYVTFVLE
ncbi:hypothetical protein YASMINEVIRUS_1159, partial [Yasminevirus sp. GU-2018]